MALEQTHVIDAYNKIASLFDKTRVFTWPKTKEFLDQIVHNDTQEVIKVADIGCGNGRNIKYLIDEGCISPTFDLRGCDASEEFVKICKYKKMNVIHGNITNLPYDDNTFDFVFCVAVIHHLSTLELRKKAVEELIRITKKGGKILIQVWAQHQKYGKATYAEQDVMIPWRQGKTSMADRYYHLFLDFELVELCMANSINILEEYIEHDNYGIVLEKI